MTNSSGLATFVAVAAILPTTPENNQRTSATQWIDHELFELAALHQRSSTASLSKKSGIAKLDSLPTTDTNHRLALNRWLSEVDIAT